jgi:E3 ubiquitin-protein ligase DMA1/2
VQRDWPRLQPRSTAAAARTDRDDTSGNIGVHLPSPAEGVPSTAPRKLHCLSCCEHLSRLYLLACAASCVLAVSGAALRGISASRSPLQRAYRFPSPTGCVLASAQAGHEARGSASPFPMLSSHVSITAPEGVNLPATPTRRRGLSYLRTLSQNRISTPGTSDATRATPRSYFVRSSSYNESRGLAANPTRRRSASRPNESTSSRTAVPATDPVNRAPTNATPKDLSLPGPTRTAPPVASQPEGGQLRSVTESMARHRTAGPKRTNSTNEPQSTRTNGDSAAETSQRQQTNGQASKPSNAVNGGDLLPESKSQLPTLRLFPHQDARSSRQSLNFIPVTRTLPSESSVIKVGRYSEREGIPITNPTAPSDAPVGFKSKVVSRKHCEFSVVNGQWHVKDVSSSSGTFLNHIRLSQPNTDSRLFPVKDGDILQLGIDFRGGEEMIFRCVKIRIECNRSWQKRPNNFK